MFRLLLWAVVSVGLLVNRGLCATAQPRYYAHPAVEDSHGVIAPWYNGLNGQCDFRIRVAAETLKRYPWTTPTNGMAAYPHYVFSGVWQIASNGTITPKLPSDWANGDLGQRATSLLNGWVDYYRYTGDPAAVAHLTYMANYLLDHCLTPPEHPWPGLFISVPVKGRAYGPADPGGMIQLDLVASTGQGLLRAYQLTGNERWFAAAKHWGDLLAERCNLDAQADPWPRYTNPEAAPWKDNKQTGGVTMILAYLEDLIRLGHLGQDQRLVAAREAGHRYLQEKLLPAWLANDTWGRYFWDWDNPVQNCLTTPDAARYLLAHPQEFPNWRCDVRNILTLFFNHSSVAPDSGGDVYSGAWAYPEACQCCGRSLWYAPFCLAPALAEYAERTGSTWARELAFRQLVLATYDAHDTGVSEDNIDGGVVVNGDWFNIAHPLPLRWILTAIGWLPEELGASRENHLLRSSAVVNSVVYGDGRIAYTTFDAPAPTVELLRLAFEPKAVQADGQRLKRRSDLKANGYTVKRLANGDTLVQVRHDGAKRLLLLGKDPQQVLDDGALAYEGSWQLEADPGAWGGAVRIAQGAGATASARFKGHQVRVIGRAEESGGLADVYLDGEKQSVPLDCWNPSRRDQQVLYYHNGLADTEHTLKLVVSGAHNPYATGNNVCVDAVQWASGGEACHVPAGRGPTETQRMIFGYPERADYRDSQGRLWRPATEWVTRIGAGKDAVGQCWWPQPSPEPITGTADPELYRYGAHARDFWANLTVGPGEYYARLKFAATRKLETPPNVFDIRINGRRVVERLDVSATAGGPNRAMDLVFNHLQPIHGMVEIRFTAARIAVEDQLRRGEAFVQALEIGRGTGGRGARPVSAPAAPWFGNLLLNPGFEETVNGIVGGPGARASLAGWTCEFGGPAQSYIWQERDYQQHPDWGLPEIHSGQGAIRTHTDRAGHTRITQEVEVLANTAYTASVWVRGADLRGRGFGRHTNDSAGLILCELDDTGRVLRQHKKVEVKAAGAYAPLAQTITTGPQTVVVRFSLDTVLHCPYQEGHVTYDDCRLARTAP